MGMKLPVGVNIGLIDPSSVSMQSLSPSESEDIIQVGGKGLHKPDRMEIERRTKDNRGDKNDRSRSRVPPIVEATGTTLLIVNIPSDLNTIEKLNSHFKQFGSIVNIQVRPQQERSFFQFSEHEEAEKALNSPEAVLGNRFIRVFWSRKNRLQEKDRRVEPEPTKAPIPPPITKVPVPAPPKEDKTRKNLQKKKDELRKSQLEQTKQLLEQISKMKDVDPKQRAELMKKVESFTNNVATSLAKDSSALEKSKE